MKHTVDSDQALVKLADGTVKQRNMLTGTEVWTVPGRGYRPLGIPHTHPVPIDADQAGRYCPFCFGRYMETPPEKQRLVRDEEGTWHQLSGLKASQLHDTVAEFRRIPNLFEIVSFDYWEKKHGHEPSVAQRQRMAEYLSDRAGYDHIMSVVKARLAAYGLDPHRIASQSEEELLRHATGFFSGGHDLIVAKRHYIDGAESTSQLASSGCLTPEEHAHYTSFTAHTIEDLYQLDPAVEYVAAFQNWLKPAGASFDHLHKQLVAIDERPVQTLAEIDRVRHTPSIYEDIIALRASRGLVLAQNDYAVAMVGVGHRYPTLAVWPLGDPVDPWKASPQQLRGVSDILHAMHAATGADVPCNEEWYHRPRHVTTPLRWRILLKWRISTLAGFEGGTRIYLNTIDPWTIRARMLPRLTRLRQQGTIAPMKLGDECQVSAQSLHS